MAKMNNPLNATWYNGSLVLSPSGVVGNVYYVDATNGASTSSGLDWDNALTTIDLAINKCSENAGDIIMVAPWHAETVTATNVCAMDTAGVELIGVSSGNQKPTISFGTDAAATIAVTAANCRISNLKLVSAVIDCTAGITASAAGDKLMVDNCIIKDGGAALEMVIGVSLAAACDGCVIVDNVMSTVPAGGCASGITLVGESERTVIARNYIQGDYSASCIDGTTAASTLLTIVDNYLINIDTTAGSCIDMNASTTGMSCNNRMMGGKSIADTWIAAGMVSIENYGTGAVSASGLVEPAVDGD